MNVLVRRVGASWETAPREGRLLRFLGTQCLIGVVAGAIFSALFLALDLAGLRSLLGATREAGLALFMFCFAIMAMFGAMAMGIGVMLLPRDANYGEGARRTVSRDDRPDR